MHVSVNFFIDEEISSPLIIAVLSAANALELSSFFLLLLFFRLRELSSYFALHSRNATTSDVVTSILSFSAINGTSFWVYNPLIISIEQTHKA